MMAVNQLQSTVAWWPLANVLKNHQRKITKVTFTPLTFSDL